MPDKFSKEVRSQIMAKIKKTDSKPELVVRKFLFKHGFRYRINVRKFPGCPDVVLSKYKTIVFINGCFWHAHKNCKYNKMPKSNREYWLPKINRNVERDTINKKTLQGMGWKVLFLWECKIMDKESEEYLLKLLSYLKNNSLK